MFSYFSLRADLTEGYESRKLELAKRLQVNLANALWNYDENQAASVIEAELDSPDVMAIYVFQKVGEGGDSAAGSLLAFRSKLTADPNARGGGGGQLQNEETVRVPFDAIAPVQAARLDGVAAALRVNASVHSPLLCVADVFKVASGQLSLPGQVETGAPQH